MPANYSPDSSVRVSQAIGLCNALLSELELSVRGEVANFSISRGKFVFFDLKDEEEEARISCFMMSHQLSMPIEDGMRVIVQGKAGLYQKSGQFRLSVVRLLPQGEGSLKRAFELLRRKLQEEGLFAQERKRPLPRYVQRVGIISSKEAAGFGDFQKIAYERLPGVQYVLANVAVQGKDAESEIIQAFDYLNSHYQLDAIVLTRGGGSQEDLHAFNSELVARAIVRSKVPVVVGVGHERDLTIADFCADLRASTPSNAAQLLLPTKEEVLEQLFRLTQTGKQRVDRYIQMLSDQVTSKIDRIGEQLRYLLKRQEDILESRMSTITALSPQNVLQRGYSITSNSKGVVVTSVANLAIGEQLFTRVIDGVVESELVTIQHGQ